MATSPEYTPQAVPAMPPEPMRDWMGQEQPATEQKHSSIQLLLQISKSDNLCELLEDGKLKSIGQRCVEEYKIDDESREEWKRSIEEALKIAKQVKEAKNFPWPNAANVKFPLLAEAAISFAARAYPELVKGKVVKAAVVGKDADGQKAQRAARVSEFMSWQVCSDMPYWESETDSLLVQLPLIGNVFRKTYHDPVKGTCDSRMVPAMDFVVNHNLKCLENARRETECIEYYGNQVLERMRAGIWRTVTLNPDKKDGVPEGDRVYKFIEQHRWLDLDEDGYEEPYVATVHTDSQTVVRIAPRFTANDVTINARNEVVKIEDTRHYTHYPFIPNPDGGLYAIGFGILLLPINESINSVLNQLLDAGTMANTSGGFIAKGIRIKGGTFRFRPQEWTFVDSTGTDLKNSIVPLPVKEPSAVLFQLLGLLIEAGKSLANLKDVLQGNLPTQNTPATTVIALIEQGAKVFNAIYKRIYRAMQAEFGLIYSENRKYLADEKYSKVLDEQASVQADFSDEDYDIIPVADPSVSSQVQRLARAQALIGLAGKPGMKDDEITREYLEAIGIDTPERFFDPNSQAAAQQQGMALMQVKAEQDLAVARQQMEKTQAEIKKLHADALQSLAKAEQAEEGTAAGQFRNQLMHLAAQLQFIEESYGNPAAGRVEGMAGAPGNPVVPVGLEGSAAGAAGAVGVGGNPQAAV